ncbi:hypothetical protein B0H10DRAFT_732768 [Mycena sp. CBHHK59/15]|nr:hypothetical protein B0H10DRAFT_732768 [Mycena sp. CBHHK59/15]
MFSANKLCGAVLALSATASALSHLQAPASPTSGGIITVTWTSDASDNDPVTIALYSTNPSYNGPFAIANNVDLHANKATFTLPEVVPGSGFSIGLLSMDDTGKVLAASPAFAIAPAAPEGATTAKPAPVSTASHGPLSIKPTHVSASGSAAHSVSTSASKASAAHSGSAASVSLMSASAAHASMTAPAASVSSVAYSVAASVVSDAHSVMSMSPVSGARPSVSATARTGAAVSVGVPTAGLALVLGLVVGAWALNASA